MDLEIIALPFLCLLTYRDDVHWTPLYWLYLGAIAYFTFKIISERKLPWLFGITWGYISYNAYSVLAWRPLTEQFEITKIVSLRDLAGHALVEFWAMSALFILFWKKIRKPLMYGFLYMGLIHTTKLLLDQTILGHVNGVDEIGLLGNRSIGASFSVVWMFFALYVTGAMRAWTKYLPWITIPATLVSQSGISYVALLTAGFVYLVFISRKFLWGIVPGIAIAAAAAPLVKPEIYSHLSRFEFWQLFLKGWVQTADWFQGWGGGTFSLYGPEIQLLNHYRDEGNFWLIFAHSDWLQVLLEFGIIGLVLVSACYAVLLKKSFNRPELFCALIAFGVVSLGNYGLHIASFSLLGVWLLFESIEGDVCG